MPEDHSELTQDSSLISTAQSGQDSELVEVINEAPLGSLRATLLAICNSSAEATKLARDLLLPDSESDSEEHPDHSGGEEDAEEDAEKDAEKDAGEDAEELSVHSSDEEVYGVSGYPNNIASLY